MKCALHGRLNMNMSPGSSTMGEPCSSMTPPHLHKPLNLPNPTGNVWEGELTVSHSELGGKHCVKVTL
jgi:hypothetical protein